MSRIFSAAAAAQGACAFAVAALLHADLGFAAVITSPDEICSSFANPCLIAQEFEVDAATPLNFGLRTVLVTPTGRLKGTLDLFCGAFASERPDVWMEIGPDTGGGDVTITALRACSGNPAVACMDDATCADASAGTCTVGEGTIRLAGTMRGNASTIRLRAAGDIALEGILRASAEPPVPDGGFIEVESFQGSIESNAVLDVTAGRDQDYGESGAGGSITLQAAIDVTVRNSILAAGGGADIAVDAGRDAVVGASVSTQGRDNGYPGGTVDLDAGRDLRVVALDPREKPLLNISGGTLQYDDYAISYGGSGGYGFLKAGGDVVVGSGVHLLGNSGFSSYNADGGGFGGSFYLDAGEDVAFDGKMTAQGLGPWGVGWIMSFAGGSVSLGAKSRIDGVSFSAPLFLVEGRDYGPVSMDGRIDLRGRNWSRYGGERAGKGGEVRVYGGDVSMGGRLLNGGGYYAGEMMFTACNLHLKKTARINARHGRLNYGDSFGTYFSVGRSMTTEPGSLIRGPKEATIEIDHGDPALPPELAGTVSPAPQITQIDNLDYWLCPH